jgi:single-stranded DNA-specific DHH superfamily exonuclease
LEKKRKEISQLTYERKKLVNKLKAKVEKIVDEKLGSQFEVGVSMAFDLCGIFVILLSGCFVLHCLSW